MKNNFAKDIVDIHAILRLPIRWQQAESIALAYDQGNL